MNPGDAAKEDAVFGHREIDARSGQDGLPQKAESGEGDAGGDQRASARTKLRAHDGGGRGGCGRESRRAERADVDEIHRSVHGDDAENATDKTARKRFLRVPDFPAKEARGLPAAVGKQDGGHRRTEGEREFEGGWLAEDGAKGNLRLPAPEKAEEFEQA